MRAEPFQIRVEEPVLDDLKLRLREARFTRVSQEPSWSVGTSSAYLRELVEYWQSGYDFRHHEAKLNELSQFKARVDGADLHFVHEKGRGSNPMPLLLLHGWPDSFYRFHKVIGRLADPSSVGGDPRDSFDVVVPSLPGFAFTGAVRTPSGAQPTRHSADLIWQLMNGVLGYRQFAVAGGDGGSVLAQILAIDHPDAVVGVHLTDIGWHAAGVEPAKVSRHEQKYLEKSKKHFMDDGAYAMVQMTRPRSLAAALNDSPVGLASWIVDRFHSWTEWDDGEGGSRIGKDELLTNIMLYWVTETIGPSMFNYFADKQSPSLTPHDHVNCPVGLALFPKDGGGIPPRSFAERTLNVQRWTEMPRGGHFAALEEPELFTNDVMEFIRPLRDRDQPRAGRHSDVHSTI